MALQGKYQPLIDLANASGVSNLQVREQDNVLYIDGVAPTGEVKDKIWNSYDSIDPNFTSGDLVLNIDVSPAAPSTKLKVTTQSSNLNIRKGPGTDQPIIGKAAHAEIVTLLSKYNNDWSLIRTDAGVEGYCSNQYLTEQ
ncbi:MAG TPA: SH3 domain-containing protein [Chitinophaga sp.]|uniref:SH3 domain-containing protein n=1 Tax=Chitinophaga sp. TaxID=1869181 RepID=UPI002C44F5A0|nr:SH3 domain-containing protein [Chitinophaga sp.]HVI46777.1 SH3 domain-containing protein [Chitinophaga sp.]